MTSKDSNLSYKLIPIAPTPRSPTSTASAMGSRVIEAANSLDSGDDLSSSGMASSSNPLQFFIIGGTQPMQPSAGGGLMSSSPPSHLVSTQAKVTTRPSPTVGVSERTTTFTSTSDRRRATHNEVSTIIWEFFRFILSFKKVKKSRRRFSKKSGFKEFMGTRVFVSEKHLRFAKNLSFIAT